MDQKKEAEEILNIVKEGMKIHFNLLQEKINNSIAKFNEDIGFILKRLRETKNPRSIKINNFSRSTLSKYNCYTRSNFGFPN